MKNEELIIKKSKYKTVFGTDVGKEVLKDLENKCFFNTSTYQLNISEHGLSFREGMRNAVLYIKKMLEEIK